MFGIIAVGPIKPSANQVERNHPLPDGVSDILTQALPYLKRGDSYGFAVNDPDGARQSAGSVEAWFRANEIPAVSVRVFTSDEGNSTLRVYPRNKVKRGQKGA